VGLTGLAEWAQLDLFAADDELETALDFWDQAAEPGPAADEGDFDMPRGTIIEPEPEAAPEPDPEPDPADVTTPVDTVEGERSPRQFGPLPPGTRGAVETAVSERRFLPGQDVAHDEFGGGWVQGSGLGRVTVRFERPWSERGRIKTVWADDPALHLVDASAVAREALAVLTAGDADPDEDPA